MISIIDTVEYRESIIKLWHECFGDDREYIEFFLDECKSKICIGYLENGRLLSMLFLLNGSLDKLSCLYIYAACTAEKSRGRGIMGSLIGFAKEYCEKRKIDALFLVPGEESLYSYYSRFGFISGMRKNKITFNGKCGDFSPMKCDNVGFIAQKRLELLSNVDGFVFDPETTEYSVREFLETDGEIYYSGGEDEFLAFAVKNGENTIIEELLVKKSEKFPKICGLFEKLSAENVYIYTPLVYNKKDNGCLRTKCGMYYPISEVANTLKENDKFYAGMYLD